MGIRRRGILARAREQWNTGTRYEQGILEGDMIKDLLNRGYEQGIQDGGYDQGAMLQRIRTWDTGP